MSATPIKKSALANRLQGTTTPLELDGKTWQLVCDFNVICELEEASGRNLLAGIQPEWLTNKFCRTWLYLCLRELGASYTEREVGQLMTKKIHLVIKALMEAYQAGMPSKEEVEAEIVDPQKAVS
jgi:hypothetical protein